MKPPAPILRKVRPRAVRTKPRPGRLKGTALAEMRVACYERDGGRCCECEVLLDFYADPISLHSCHMAHIKAKRMGGDNLNNVRALCGDCHRKEHVYGKCGVKPVPRKG